MRFISFDIKHQGTIFTIPIDVFNQDKKIYCWAKIFIKFHPSVPISILKLFKYCQILSFPSAATKHFTAVLYRPMLAG
jgi:hypothetical protein